MSRAAANNTAENGIFDASYRVAQLRIFAKEKRIPGYSTMTKAELLEVLNNGT